MSARVARLQRLRRVLVRVRGPCLQERDGQDQEGERPGGGTSCRTSGFAYKNFALNLTNPILNECQVTKTFALIDKIS